MLLLSLLVAGATCYMFPPSSYHLNDTRAVSIGYPRVIGFFGEDGVDKFGVDIYGIYFTFDCTGKNRKIFRSGKTVAEYQCNVDLVPFSGSNHHFRMNAYFPFLNKSCSIAGMFITNNEVLLLDVNSEIRRFTYETDNGSTRKSLPRALYRLRDKKDFAGPVPQDIGFFEENGVDRISMEIHNFYYIYTCDSERHFHYEDKKLVNTYFCSDFILTDKTIFVLHLEIRQPQTELYEILMGVDDKLSFTNGEDTVTYTTNSAEVAETPTTPKPTEVFPIAAMKSDVRSSPYYPVTVFSKTNKFGFGQLTFSYIKDSVFATDVHARSADAYFTCDGRTRSLHIIVPKKLSFDMYRCTATREGPGLRAKFEIVIEYPRLDDRLHYFGEYSSDGKTLYLEERNHRQSRMVFSRIEPSKSDF